MKKESKIRIYANYNRSNKWMGIIEYKLLVFVLIYIFLIVKLISLFHLKFEISIYFFSVLVFPILSIALTSINNENSLNSIKTLIAFLFKSGIYIDKKYQRNLKNEIYINNNFSKINKDIVKYKYK